MHRLEAPIAGDELRGQPIEQLGVRGQRTLGAEVVLCLDNSAAEVTLPDAVHRYPGRQWVFLAYEPAGHVEAGIAFLFRKGGQHRRGAGPNLNALVQKLAAQEHVCRPGRRQLPHHEGARDFGLDLLYRRDCLLALLMSEILPEVSASDSIRLRLVALVHGDIEDGTLPRRQLIERLAAEGHLPLGLLLEELLLVGLQLLLHHLELRPDRLAPGMLLRGAEFHHRLEGTLASFVVLELAAQLVDAVEEREESIELLL